MHISTHVFGTLMLCTTLVIAQEDPAPTRTESKIYYINLSPEYESKLNEQMTRSDWVSVNSLWENASGAEGAAKTSLQSVIYNSALPSAERDALYDSLYSLIPTQVQSYQNSWASDFSRILQTFDPSNPGERPVLTTSSTATPTLSESLAASVSVSASANVPVSVSPSVSASPSASASSSSSASAGRTEVLVHGAVAGAIGIGAVLL